MQVDLEQVVTALRNNLANRLSEADYKIAVQEALIEKLTRENERLQGELDEFKNNEVEPE